MTDIIDRLKEPEAHYPGNFDTPKRANAMLSCLCQEAMEEIESLRQQLAEKDAEIEQLNSKLQSQALDCIAADGQAFDNWQQLAASQARDQQLLEKVHLALTVNYSREFADNRAAILQEAIALPQDTAALEGLIAKAGEVMLERIVVEMRSPFCSPSAIRAIPAVTIDDLK